MAQHPHFRFRADTYKGKDHRRLREVEKQQWIAAALQKFVDEKWTAGKYGVYTTEEIMAACRIDPHDRPVVELLMMGTAHSSNGLTITQSDGPRPRE